LAGGGKAVEISDRFFIFDIWQKFKLTKINPYHYNEIGFNQIVIGGNDGKDNRGDCGGSERSGKNPLDHRKGKTCSYRWGCLHGFMRIIECG